MKLDLVQSETIRKALESLLGKKEARVALQTMANGEGTAVLRAEDLGWL